MTSGHSLSIGIRSSASLIGWFVADLTPAELLHRAVPKSNCTAWLLGHLILSTRSMAVHFGNPTFPALPDGFEARFTQKDGAPDKTDFGDTSQLAAILQTHLELFAKAVEATPDSVLEKVLPNPHPLFSTVASIAAFAPIHLAVHAGQISTIRRSLGRPPLV